MSKVAVVTGGSRGIGFAIARTLLSHGVDVVISGTREETLASSAKTLAVRGQVHHVVADVRDPAAVKRLMHEAVDRFGGLDVLVNNAGVGVYQPVEEMSIDNWDLMFDTNLKGVLQ